MDASPVVVLLVALGGAREPSTRSMATAAQDALDPSAVVLVREVPDATLASDVRAVSLADAVHADAVAVLTWPDADHHRAHVHVYAARPMRWVDRDIEFRDVDAAEERGKALGYAVAAMVLPHHEAPPRDQPAPLPPPPRPVPPPLPPPPPPAARERRLAVDLVAVGSGGIGGDAGGFGSEAGARWRFFAPLSFRIGGGFRIGQVPSAQASTQLGRFDAGLAVAIASLGEARPVTLGVRADAVLLYQVVSRPGAHDTTSTGSRVDPAGDGLAELGWSFVPGAALVAAGGVEVAGSKTAVLVDGQDAATIPRVRIIGEFGIRAFF